MITSTPSPLLNTFEATPVIKPLCQKPPSPITAIGRFAMLGATAAALAKDMAIAENGIAERERRESREGMTANIGADVNRSELTLRQFDRRKDRTLRTAGAEIRRSRRNIAERRKCAGAMGDDLFDLARNDWRIDAGGLRRDNEGG